MKYTSNTYNDTLKYVKSNTSQYAVVVKHDPTTETVKPKPKTVKSKPTIAKPMTSKPITAKPMVIKPNVALYVNDIPTTDHLITSKPVTSKSKPMVMSGYLTNEIWSGVFDLIINKGITFNLTEYKSFTDMVMKQAIHYQKHGYLAPWPSSASITGSVLENEEYWQKQKIHQVLYYT